MQLLQVKVCLYIKRSFFQNFTYKTKNMKTKKNFLLLALLLVFGAFAQAQISTKGNIEDDIWIENSFEKLKNSNNLKTLILKPNLGGQPVVPSGNTVILNPGTYLSYLWEGDGSTLQTRTITGEGQCCNKVTVADENGNTGDDQVSVTIKNPTVGFYNIERSEPYSCSDVIRLKAFSYCDAGGYIVPGFAISIRTDENSLTENKMVFLRNGKKYAEEGIGKFTNNSKHYINLQYITPSDKWEYVFVDIAENGDFHSVSQDNSDWLMIERQLFSFSEGTDSLSGYLGYAKGTATFSGPGVVNNKNGYGWFYAQVAGPGTHTITYTWDDGRGFVGSASQTITVADNLPTINAGKDTSICLNNSVVLGGNPTASNGTPEFVFQWEPAIGLDDPNSSNPIATPLETTTYIGMTADNYGEGCVASDTVTIFVNAFSHTGIIQNDTSLCAGDNLILSAENNYSFDFDGYDDHINVNDHNALDLTSEGTVEAWIFAHSYKPFGGIVHKGDQADWWDEAYTLQLWNDQKIKFAVVGEGESNKNISMLSSVSNLSLDEWHHIVGVWNTEGLKLYIDGILDNSIAETKVARISSGGLNIGTQLTEIYNDKLGKIPFDGLIDEVRIWNKALMQNEITEKMQKLLNPDEENGLVAYFDFNEGVGGKTFDLTENQLVGNIYEPQWSAFTPFNQTQYNYIWSTGENTPVISINPSQSNYYYLNISSEECSLNDSIFVQITDSDEQSILGNVNYSQGQFSENDLSIKAYKLPNYDLIQEQNINYNSQYQLNLNAGKYILRAVLNNLNYPDVINTYYDSTYSYKLAKIIDLKCGETYQADIKMFEAEPLPSKSINGSISGTIHYSTQAKTNQIEANKQNIKTSNLPVIGAVVTAESEAIYKPLNITETNTYEPYLFHQPQFFAQTNFDGFYELKNLLSGIYALQVNIPGLPLNSTYELEIDENNSNYNNINFLVGANISADNSTTTVENLINYNFSLKVFPNPTNEKIFLKLNLQENNAVNCKIYNSTGSLLESHDFGILSTGEFVKELKINETGIYFIEVKIGNTVCFEKIIKN